MPYEHIRGFAYKTPTYNNLFLEKKIDQFKSDFRLFIFKTFLINLFRKKKIY